MNIRQSTCFTLLTALAVFGCTTESDPNDPFAATAASLGGTTTGDGDGDATTTGDGDGDGDPTTGDGDPTTGDGDPDPTTGDGDGDGDPDPTTGGNESPCTAADPGWGGFAQVGQPAPHFSGMNQFGEESSICAYEGLPIVIDTSAVWCGPCQLLSQCLGGNNDPACLDLFGGNQQAVDVLIHPMLDQINADQFGWVTVLMENVNNGPPSLSDAQAWDQNYPVEKVWVIADEQQNYAGHLQISAFPSVWLIDGQMNWQDLNQDTVWNTIISVL